MPSLQRLARRAAPGSTGITARWPPSSTVTPSGPAPTQVTGRRFIFGLPMNCATKTFCRLVVELHRRADLGDVAGVEHDDPVGHGHRLDLVVGDVDHRGAELPCAGS